jgi:hypothetical protein
MTIGIHADGTPAVPGGGFVDKTDNAPQPGIRTAIEWLYNRAPATTARIWLYGLVLGAIFEAITLLLRFGAGHTARETFSFLAPYTFGWRAHHSYMGVLVVIVAFFIVSRPWRRWLFVLGLALILSDLAHHFLILWPLTGSPEFDLRYPGY